MRPHRRQEHHRLAPPNLRAQRGLRRHHLRLQPRLVVAAGLQRLSSVRARVVLPHVQVVRGRLVHPVVRHRHRRWRGSRPQQEVGHRVIRKARQEQVVHRLPAPRDRQEVGLRRLAKLGVQRIQYGSEQRLQRGHVWDGIVRPRPQPEANRVFPLLGGARHAAPGAAHTGRRRRPPDRQVHRGGPGPMQALLQQLLDRRGRSVGHRGFAARRSLVTRTNPAVAGRLRVRNDLGHVGRDCRRRLGQPGVVGSRRGICGKGLGRWRRRLPAGARSRTGKASDQRDKHYSQHRPSAGRRDSDADAPKSAICARHVASAATRPPSSRSRTNGRRSLPSGATVYTVMLRSSPTSGSKCRRT